MDGRGRAAGSVDLPTLRQEGQEILRGSLRFFPLQQSRKSAYIDIMDHSRFGSLFPTAEPSAAPGGQADVSGGVVCCPRGRRL